MLQARTIEIIKSTVPVLEVHGKAITSRFYQLLFTKHPELLNIFNHANQKKGRQQAALANAVYAAAANIEKLETIIPVVKQIAHKHRSLGVKPEHYPIVGENLLQAIKDVLGDAATDDIINAWAEAYGVIADVFIGVERDMYEAAEQQKGGWDGFRAFVVADKVEESSVITSFYLKPQDGGPIAEFKPGQYVSVRLEIPGETNTHIRQYSLSDAPGKEHYRISVKKEKGTDSPDGIVSVYLHEGVKAGDVLYLSAPAGDFYLDTESEKPAVLISGGVGLTPLVSMLKTAAEKQPEREVTFIHAAINGKTHALKNEVKKVAEDAKNISTYFVYEKPLEEDFGYDQTGYIDVAWLCKVLPLEKEAEYYFCGPVPFMKAIYHALQELNIKKEQIHFEFFGPASDLEKEKVNA
ncbi:NO-inducible flavohemoprotein [Fictibacillus phosphorivorans]|uniref:NO-inducible flavohemoprotein n=1 Tax=Fictibacillus phosphorivorans TaxID=1221500 RepID=UPI00203BB278|nr:NO-inducible flavohemoprotein [Fictibacillus phosphorivorans]MCM3719028.1 NO-inducible flavohemoprotein [Fictibacillus phosphorivorans]MCM3776650.1 NO-inducible flavohemoprotein [Fictibacillus phosphorivorans]